MSTLDYEGYTKALEATRDGLQRDYWAGLLDINRHQVNVGRNYLWVSAALIGAYVAAFDRYNDTIVTYPCVLVISAFSFVLAALAFGVCLYAIPARKGYIAIPERGWGEFSHEAYNLLKKNTPNLYAAFLTSHVAIIDNAYAHNFRTNRTRAKLLRCTSWLLISSFVLAVFVGGVIAFDKSTITQSKETAMSNETSNSKEPKPESKPAEPQLNVPKPPPPADIGGSDISTHSKQQSKKNRMFTEWIDRTKK